MLDKFFFMMYNVHVKNINRPSAVYPTERGRRMNEYIVKKALRCCAAVGFETSCSDCPYCYRCNDLSRDALNIIVEQEKEIDRLKIQLEQANAGIVNCGGCKLVEINVVRDFAEKLKKYSYTDNCFTDGKWHRYVLVSDIDELLKEYEE